MTVLINLIPSSRVEQARCGPGFTPGAWLQHPQKHGVLLDPIPSLGSEHLLLPALDPEAGVMTFISYCVYFWSTYKSILLNDAMLLVF